MDVLKQNVGIDVAKDSFVATMTVLLSGQVLKYLRTKTFKNNRRGFEELIQWSSKQSDSTLPLHFTMEATGVYYESLAYYLWELDHIIHVLLPNKAKKFADSLNIKSKTDKVDSKILGQMGVERSLFKWSLNSKIYRTLRTLVRERQQVIKERTRCKNQLHAEKHSAEPLKSTVTRMRNHIKYLDKQVKAIEKDIENTVSKDQYVAEKVKKITTVPGLRSVTVITVVAETLGFANISSIKQLNSYAGYDVQIRESGKWKGKSRISKKGNSHIRQAMYMPSLSSITYSQTYRKFYLRLKDKKQNGLISGTAVQRKLVGLIYTLWKKDEEYIENYQASV